MATKPVTDAALRLRKNLEDAKEHNSYAHGWYAQMARWDIETLIDYVLAPAENAEPEEEELVVINCEPNKPIEISNEHPGPEYITGTGQALFNLHHEWQCEGRPCVIHHPSDHHMKDWPTNWRDGFWPDIKPPHFERICEHGVGHPDPDTLAYFTSRGDADSISVHGCDGCCKPPTDEAPGAELLRRGSSWHTPPALHGKKTGIDPKDYANYESTR